MDEQDPLTALIAAHPELDADELQGAWDAMEEDPTSVRPYDEGERGAHELVIAYIQHLGTPDWDETAGEQTARSRAALLDKMSGGLGTLGLVTVETEDEESERVLLPVDVLWNLLADYTMLLNVHVSPRSSRPGLSLVGSQQEDDGAPASAQEFVMSQVQRRLVDDTARKAWVAAYGEPGSSKPDA